MELHFHKHNKTGANGGHTIIGQNVTVGNSAVIHAATIEDNAFIGMSSTIMDLSLIKSGAMLGAGSLLTPGKIIEENELWSGVPAKFMRKMKEEEVEYTKISANNYNALAGEYIISEKNHSKNKT